MSIGEVIYKNRKKAGVSQEELADMLGVTRQSISLWETDQTLPAMANLVKLAEIFNIGLDEFRNTEQRNSEPVQAGVEQPVGEASVAYNKQLLKSISYAKTGFVQILIILIIIFACSFMVLLMPADGTVKIAVPVIIALIAVGIGLVNILNINKQVQAVLKNYPDLKITVRFYLDRIEIDEVSSASAIKLSKSYAEIKKVKAFKNFILIYFNAVTVPVMKDSLSGAEAVMRLLKLDYREITVNNVYNIKLALLSAFILSILALPVALMVVIACYKFSPMPEFSNSLFEYTWVFYPISVLPLGSAILGVVFLIKKYKCKKNVIAGFIICAVMAVYGSFAFLINTQHDFGFVDGVESVLPIDLPDSGYVSYTLDKNDVIKADGMVRFDEAERILEIAESGQWLTDVSALPRGILPEYVTRAAAGYDYFYLYDVTCGTANYLPYGSHAEHEFIYLAYSKDINILKIVCLTV